MESASPNLIVICFTVIMCFLIKGIFGAYTPKEYEDDEDK